MTERWWTVDGVPDALLDWVNENIVEAIKDCWEGDDKPVPSVSLKEGGRFWIKIIGPEKPTDSTGKYDCYSLEFDLLEELSDYGWEYTAFGGPCSDAQRDDMRARAAALRTLAGGIIGVAQRMEEEAGR